MGEGVREEVVEQFIIILWFVECSFNGKKEVNVDLHFILLCYCWFSVLGLLS